MTLRLVSYNIHAGVGTDKRLDPERIADVLVHLDADAIALQEVHSLFIQNRELLRYFSDRTGLVPVAGTTLLRRGRHYGNALLARPPVLRIRRGDLSLPGREPRGFIDVDLGWSPTLRLITTHLGLRVWERRRQIQLLQQNLSPAKGLTLLLGDLNEWLPWSNNLQRLHRQFGRRPAVRSWPSRLPLFALDRFWLYPSTTTAEIQAIDTPLTRTASDHLPVLVTLPGSEFSTQGAKQPRPAHAN